MNCSPPGSSLHGISQARILRWVAISFSRGSSRSMDRTRVSCIAWGFFLTEPAGNPICTEGYVCVCVLVPPLCLTLCDTKDYSQPGSSVHGILHARILEWLPISFSRGSSQPKDQTLISCIAGWFFTIWATREDSWETRAAHIECYLWYKRNILNHK